MSIINVDGLKYNQLRKVAKRYGINTRQKAADLRAALREVLQTRDQSAHSDTEFRLTRESDESQVKISTPQSAEPTKESFVTQARVRRSSHVDASSSSISSGYASRHSPSAGLSKSGTDSRLNVTYELESPKSGQTPDDSEGRSNLIEHSAKNQPEAQSRSAPQSSDRSVRNVCQQGPAKTSAVRPVPNFHRIHARAASKMESLPQFMHRLQAMRPPFASPPYHPTSGTGNMSSSKPSRALQDLSNRASNPVGAKRSSGQSTTVMKLDSSIHNTTQPRVSANLKPLIHKYTPKIPADSAFARRKAYDLKRNMARLSNHTPNRKCGTTAMPSTHDSTTTSVAPSSTEVLAPLTSKHPSSTTVPRIDPREQRPGLSVTMQRERNASITQVARQQARRAMADSRRGLI